MNDPKYEGVRTSRRQLYEGDDQVNEDDNEDEEHMSDDVHEQEDEESSEDTEDDEELQSPAEDGASQDESGSASDDEMPQSRTQAARKHVSEASAALSRIDLGRSETPGGKPVDSQPEGDIAANLRITHEADRRKGKAVSRQIVSSPCIFSNVSFSVVCPGPVGHAARCAHTATKGCNGCKPTPCGESVSNCLHLTSVHEACSRVRRRGIFHTQELVRR